MGLDLTKSHSEKNGIFDFLGDKEFLEVGDGKKTIELDYEWDF